MGYRKKYSSYLSVLSLCLSLVTILVPKNPVAGQTEAFGTLSAQRETASASGKLKFDTNGENGSPEIGSTTGGGTRFAEQLNFQAPEDEGAPQEGTTGGATRGSQGNVCPQDRNRNISAPLVTAVLPVSNEALTVSGHPKLWIYVPKTSAAQGRFILHDDNDLDRVVEIYDTTFDLPKNLTETGGLVSIQMPETLEELEIGKTYTYYVTLKCSEADGGIINYDQGFITRKEIPDSIADVQANQALSAEQALWEQTKLYAESGIWVETLNNLLALIENEPNNRALQNQWMSLLRSEFVNLDEAIGNAKIVHLYDFEEGTGNREQGTGNRE